MKPNQKRFVRLAGLAAILLIATTAWLFRGHFRLYWLFESLGRNEQGYVEYRHKQTGIVFVRVSGGTYLMGSLGNEVGRNEDEGPQHEVTLSPFLIAKNEVINSDYEKVMGGLTSYSRWPHVPTESVSWENCQAFCEKVGFSLPTEAQWEYACRAGKAEPFAGTGTLDDMAWFKGNHQFGVGNDTMHAPGDKPPNDFGIHDMHGNLAEWCRDWYQTDFYQKSVGTRDPLCVNSATGNRVIRGGGWNDSAEACRSASRNKNVPSHRAYNLGFRPVWSSQE